MRLLFICLFFILTIRASAAQTNCSVSGQLHDQSGEPVIGAHIMLAGSSTATTSDAQGRFCLLFDREEGTVIITHTSFESVTRIFQAGDLPALWNPTLNTASILMEDIVVTAGRHPEKITDAPAETRVINRKALEQFSFANPVELAAREPGVEFVRSGVNTMYLNARGFNNANNAKMLHLTDGRLSMFAGSNGIPAGIMNTVTKEDVEQIEIVLGPNSALYGPNAHNGVVNIITRDPRKYTGTAVALSTGNREQFSMRLRHAGKLKHHWSYKLTGENSVGEDYHFNDSVFAGGGSFGTAVTIPEKIKTYQFRHLRGEAHLYYTLNKRAYMAASYGRSHNNYINVSNLTRNQGQGWAFSYLQLRYVDKSWFAQVYETWTDAGNTYGTTPYTRDYWNRTHSSIRDTSDPLYATSGYLPPDSAQTYSLRIGNRFKEKSRRLNGEAQYNHSWEDLGLLVIGSLSYQLDKPDSYGSIIADRIDKISIHQEGVALHVEKNLPWKLKAVAALRVDHHSFFGTMASPKASLTRPIGKGTARVTWAKAYAAPLILYQRASLFGTIFGNANGISYIPNGTPVNEGIRRTTSPLRPEEIHTTEIGYKGAIDRKLSIAIDAYYGITRRFLSPGIAVSGRATSMGDIGINPESLAYPGTVTDDGILQGASFSSYFNYGKVHAYGVDLHLAYAITPTVTATVSYSWFGSDITRTNLRNDANRDGYVSDEERSLNAPAQKCSIHFGWQQLLHTRLYLNVSMRWVERYDMYSGNQIGTAAGKNKRGIVYGGVNPIDGKDRYYLKNFNWGALGGFTTFDVSFGYPFGDRHNVGVSVTNIFNTRQVEFLASPSISRLLSIELVLHVP